MLKKENGNTEGKYIPLEVAFALCFPLLFPFVKLEKIPGNKHQNEKNNIIVTFLVFNLNPLHLIY